MTNPQAEESANHEQGAHWEDRFRAVPFIPLAQTTIHKGRGPAAPGEKPRRQNWVTCTCGYVSRFYLRFEDAEADEVEHIDGAHSEG
jgi:hypothetical protein